MAQNDYTYGEYTPIAQRRTDSEIARAIARYRAQQAQEAAAAADQLETAEQNGGQRFTRDGQEIIVSNRPQNRRQRGNNQQQQPQGLFGARAQQQQQAQQQPQGLFQPYIQQGTPKQAQPAPAQQQQQQPYTGNYFMDAPNDMPVVSYTPNNYVDYDVDTYREPTPAQQQQQPYTGNYFMDAPNDTPVVSYTPDYANKGYDRLRGQQQQQQPYTGNYFMDAPNDTPVVSYTPDYANKGYDRLRGQQQQQQPYTGNYYYGDYGVDTYREPASIADLVYRAGKAYDPSTGKQRKKKQEGGSR